MADRALADGMELVESLVACAEPGGPVVRQVYEDFRAEIPADLAAAIRAVVGHDVVIGVELDLHCWLTQKLVVAADVIVSFKDYSHVDVVERAA